MAAATAAAAPAGHLSASAQLELSGSGQVHGKPGKKPQKTPWHGACKR
jgi:hypothetical protein